MSTQMVAGNAKNVEESKAESMIKIVAESGHYYWPDGRPAYTIIGSNGKKRKTNLRDAKKLGLYPSVTEILKIMAKQGLINWFNQQLVLAALTLPRNDGEELDAFAERVVIDAAEHGKQAADLGTQIHAAVQGAFDGQPVPLEYGTFVSATMAAMNKEWPMKAWKCEQSFAHPLGFGGKVDAHSINGRIVIDWKTTGFTEDKLPKGYDEHLIQLAAYALGLGIESAQLANVYISTTVPGLVHIVKWTENDRKRGVAMFMHILDLWKLSKGYNP